MYPLLDLVDDGKINNSHLGKQAKRVHSRISSLQRFFLANPSRQVSKSEERQAYSLLSEARKICVKCNHFDGVARIDMALQQLAVEKQAGGIWGTVSNSKPLIKANRYYDNGLAGVLGVSKQQVNGGLMGVVSKTVPARMKKRESKVRQKGLLQQVQAGNFPLARVSTHIKESRSGGKGLFDVVYFGARQRKRKQVKQKGLFAQMGMT